jgi:hypothetical protein
MEQSYDTRTARLLENWPFLHIFKAGRQSFQASKLLLAATGLLLTLATGGVLDVVWTTAGGGYTGRELREATPPLILSYARFEDDKRVGLFAAMRQHTSHCVTQGLSAARMLHLTGGMGSIRGHLNSGGARLDSPSAETGYGALAFVAAWLSGVLWVVRNHWLFALVCGTLLLALWSVLGGAICRISTLRLARDEFLSARQALRFSTARMWSFFLAPAVLVVIMLILGLAIILGTLVLNGLTQVSWLAWLGWPLIGILFVLSLAAGTTIALIAFGMLGGSHLMWPTVAAEGSDFTDAISRSGYFLQAIERAIGYGVCALIFGGLAWTVVRGVAWLALWTTHSFVELGLADINKLWVTPSFDAFYVGPSLPPDGQLDIDSWAGRHLAPLMIRGWVGLVSLLVGGYLVSYYFTSSTIIYHLLRRAVDETEIDDIYTEGQSEGEEGAEAMEDPASAAVPAASSSVPRSGNPGPAGTTAAAGGDDSCVAP